MKPFEQGVQGKGDSSVETVVRGNTEFALAPYQEASTVEGNLIQGIIPNGESSIRAPDIRRFSHAAAELVHVSTRQG